MRLKRDVVDKFERIETDIINITSIPCNNSILSEVQNDIMTTVRKEPSHHQQTNRTSISIHDEKKKHQSMVSSLEEDSLIQEEIKLKNEEQFKEILTEF